MTDAPTILSPSKKYCEDCKFCFVPTNGIKFARCTNPAVVERDDDRFLAPQFDLEVHPYATVTRKCGGCGEAAVLFEPKTEAEAA